ncbi:dipeptide ABC transporter ATP-binding protein [Micromonospora echinofusca]|uniref:Dipeptide ABC transporter ATP-binding protein n=1 Tax=Micromonospora echinofusca TaxID=47858 RepID=A0ABS3VQL4_MICEH|nr:ABC transporter ATP-binding protein [Micromonospora echinofusca]MBO4206773.1 dipeptide ABC transporter ATP-binding protein [Micromonospora echinofusca]
MTPAVPQDEAPDLLTIEDLTVEYLVGGRRVRAVEQADLSVSSGEIVALVGESGSGKSSIAHAVLGALPAAGRIVGGRIGFDGLDLARLSERRFNQVRGRSLGFIPQDPMSSLNPLHRIGTQVTESIRIHRSASRAEAARQAVELLDRVGLPEPAARARQFPHELSGGMRQRALIAAALAGAPRLLVADEPTTALDVTVQKVILDDLSALARSGGIAVLVITHDLAVAADRADRIVVLRHGRIVESGTPDAVLGAPCHPYTRMLLASAPSLAAGRRRRSRPAGRSTPGATVTEPGGHRAPVAPTSGRDLVRVDGVTKEFRVPHTDRNQGWFRAVDDVSLTIGRGETLGLVGESGSGKSTLARLILRLTPPTAGRIAYDGTDIADVDRRGLRGLRARAQLVYQNPYGSLNPRLTVRQIVAEPLVGFGIGDRSARGRRVRELLDQVGLPGDLAERRPAELSGGQRQRVAIARALAPSPELLVCDEPVSALDVSIQAQILDLLADLQVELGLSLLFVSHDLAVIRQVADRVGVMRAGRLVEIGPADQVFHRPGHGYTRTLLAAIPGQGFGTRATGRAA